MVVFCWLYCLFPRALILKASNKVTKSTCGFVWVFLQKEIATFGAAEHYRAAAELEVTGKPRHQKCYLDPWAWYKQLVQKDSGPISFFR